METMKAVREDVGNVKILINNAGTVCCKPLWDLPEKVIENTYAVNILSHYWTVKSCLDDMIESGGHIETTTDSSHNDEEEFEDALDDIPHQTENDLQAGAIAPQPHWVSEGRPKRTIRPPDRLNL
uniref:Uncharacterized protein n=1 Tax=Phlebotomus papatasi TaxID=29031 RepID=A0A1B0DI16_PHLPP